MLSIQEVPLEFAGPKSPSTNTVCRVQGGPRVTPNNTRPDFLHSKSEVTVAGHIFRATLLYYSLSSSTDTFCLRLHSAAIILFQPLPFPPTPKLELF